MAGPAGREHERLYLGSARPAQGIPPPERNARHDAVRPVSGCRTQYEHAGRRPFAVADGGFVGTGIVWATRPSDCPAGDHSDMNHRPAMPSSRSFRAFSKRSTQAISPSSGLACLRATRSECSESSTPDHSSRSSLCWNVRIWLRRSGLPRRPRRVWRSARHLRTAPATAQLLRYRIASRSKNAERQTPGRYGRVI
jgi:hypothetical protein